MLTIAAEIAGRRVGRAAVLEWENKRIDRAANKIKVTAPPTGVAPDRREAFLRQKLELGSDELRRRLSRDVRIADLFARVEAAASPRRRRSAIDLYADGSSADAFVAWFEAETANTDTTAMLRACPDHFVFGADSSGQQVLETTGGSPFATQFTVDYQDTSSLLTQPDDAFPHQVAGVARAANGTPIGGVRHQFRQEGNALHARLTVEFPLPFAPWMLAAHRWHLACEFSNWIEAAHA